MKDIIRFKCIQCGQCCSQKIENELCKDKIIPIYPEEADLMEIYAKDNNIPLRLMENNVLPDIKNKEIIVTRYNIILDEANDYVCPFSNKENNNCSIYDIRPLVCRAYPVSMKQIDAFNQEIYIDRTCKAIKPIEKCLNGSELEDIKQIFPIEYRMAINLFSREKKIAMKLRELEAEKKICLNNEITIEEFEKALDEWERRVLYVDDY